MALTPGAHLGPYEIQSALGAGGMGEVYRARDPRLDRSVALKILPAALAADPHFRARFDREGRAISQLAHPHICALYDVGEHDGMAFLVMELLDGDTLAERLKKGALSPEQALTVAIEVASALDAAHRHGIVHRDLKPGNVMLTKAGAKLLDFGLAKAGRPALAGASLSTLPTTPPNLTAQGMILGTLQYMAPEQLEGQDAGARTDLFAFGAVLYEMLTGRKAFEGNTQATLIAAIIGTNPPPVSQMQPTAPAMLDRVVATCLAKDPDERWESAHDIKLQLASIASQSAEPSSSWVSSRRQWALAMGLLTTVATIGGFVAGRRASPVATLDHVVGRFSVGANAGIANLDSQSSVAVSADGRWIAFLGRVGEKTQLFLHRLDRENAIPLEATSDALAPFFSPDGRWLGIFQDGKLRKVSVEGGTPQTIADAPSPRGAVWRSDGTIFFAPSQTGPIFQVSADGGTPRPVTTLDTTLGETSHRFPQLLDDGDTLLFTVRIGGTFDNAQIAAVRLSSGERKTVVRGGVDARYLSSGHLVFAKGTTLMAAPFDREGLEMLKSPVVLLDGIRYGGNGGIADFGISDNGTLVYAPASLYSGPGELVRVNRGGEIRPIIGEQRAFREVSVSPDGQSVVTSIDDGESVGLWMVDIARGTIRPLVREHRNEAPFWTPDGERIVFSSNRGGPSNLFSLRLDGAAEPQLIKSSQEFNFPTGVTPDGRSVLYGEVNAATGWDIWLQPLDGAGAASKVLGTPSHERQARIAPNGRALAFDSDESGRSEVYVVAFPMAGQRVQVSTHGGTQPVWAHSGKELFFRQEDALMAVPVDTVARPSVGPAKMLFRAAFKTSALYALTYDVMPDDQGFVAVHALGPETVRVNVVLNWMEELKQRVPTR